MLTSIKKYINITNIKQLITQVKAQRISHHENNLLSFLNILVTLHYTTVVNETIIGSLSLQELENSIRFLKKIQFNIEYNFSTICSILSFVLNLKSNPENNVAILNRDFTVSIHYVILYILKKFKAREKEPMMKVLQILNGLTLDVNLDHTPQFTSPCLSPMRKVFLYL